MDIVPLGQRHPNKENETKQSAFWGRCPNGGCKSHGADVEECEDPQDQQDLKTRGRVSFRSCGVGEDPPMSSN